jgi:hypothetical protein
MSMVHIPDRTGSRDLSFSSDENLLGSSDLSRSPDRSLSGFSVLKNNSITGIKYLAGPGGLPPSASTALIIWFPGVEIIGTDE